MLWTSAMVGPTGTTLGAFTSSTTNPGNTFKTSAQLAPQSVSANPVCPNDVQVSWAAPAGGWATNYRVYGSTSANITLDGSNNPVAPATKLAEGVTATTYYDSARLLSVPPTYYYKVAAFDAGGGG